MGQTELVYGITEVTNIPFNLDIIRLTLTLTQILGGLHLHPALILLINCLMFNPSSSLLLSLYS